MLNVSAPACELPRPTGSNDFTVDLAVLQEMTQELASLFGLALPIPFKKQAHTMTGYQLVPELH